VDFNWVVDSLISLGRVLGLMILIIIPVSILTEYLKNTSLLSPSGVKQGEKVRRLRMLGMSEKAYFPLLTGVVLGFVYGAGILIQFIREGDIGFKDRFLIIVFMAVCHAIIEDTLLFVPLGVNPLLLAGLRLIGAVVLTSLLSGAVKETNEISGSKPQSIGQ
jgi:hypothetical protein